ncbi:hypothetical protein P154DRAFT_441978 [Amniculicola lignicola CBS 123094]|uniref:Methyltransferase-domain-containing protein n=1 Tax=Amniculicola lignicola CBS 123094 TaxID=1392246 RepID=A0A6A5W5F7_9PLEO|nr:hypothetical protein P154DRAFT_441978 [Amniculicola lignicola CBS 123094]
MDTDTYSRLNVLRRQFLQLVEPTQLRWPGPAVLKHSEVQKWLSSNLFDRSQGLPPPERYQLRVLKTLISKIENAIDDPEEDVRMPSAPLMLAFAAANPQSHGQEISDDLMTTLSTLLGAGLPSESMSAQQKAYVTYSFTSQSTSETISGDCAITLLEARSIISSCGTTGLRTWEAALFLGAYLVSDRGRDRIRGKRILELGTGTGLISILCSKHLTVSGIVATDGDEAIVDAMKTNIFLNGLDIGGSVSPVRTASLKWGYPLNAPTFAEDYGMEVPDLVLGADITYDKLANPLLVSTLREFFDLNAELHVLIAATIRNEKTFEIFENACRRNGFSLELIDFPPVPEHLQNGPFYPTSPPMQIWQITRKQTAQDPFSF